MILRRIAADFRRQDLAAVFLELVIVLAGVFIGMERNDGSEAHR